MKSFRCLPILSTIGFKRAIMVAEAQGTADDERFRQSPIMLKDRNGGEKVSYEEANVQKGKRS